VNLHFRWENGNQKNNQAFGKLKNISNINGTLFSFLVFDRFDILIRRRRTRGKFPAPWGDINIPIDTPLLVAAKRRSRYSGRRRSSFDIQFFLRPFPYLAWCSFIYGTFFCAMSVSFGWTIFPCCPFLCGKSKGSSLLLTLADITAIKNTPLLYSVCFSPQSHWEHWGFFKSFLVSVEKAETKNNQAFGKLKKYSKNLGDALCFYTFLPNYISWLSGKPKLNTIASFLTTKKRRSRSKDKTYCPFLFVSFVPFVVKSV